jgi:hypothetical protein
MRYTFHRMCSAMLASTTTLVLFKDVSWGSDKAEFEYHPITLASLTVLMIGLFQIRD